MLVLQVHKFINNPRCCILKMSGFGLLPVLAPLLENVNKITPDIFQYDENINTVCCYLKPFN